MEPTVVRDVHRDVFRGIGVATRERHLNRLKRGQDVLVNRRVRLLVETNHAIDQGFFEIDGNRVIVGIEFDFLVVVIVVPCDVEDATDVTVIERSVRKFLGNVNPVTFVEM